MKNDDPSIENEDSSTEKSRFLVTQVLPFLNKTTIFLYPCVAVGALYIVSLVTRWNVSVFVLTMYFGHE